MTDFIGQPREGFYWTRLRKGCIWVAVRFWLEGDTWCVLVNGSPLDQDGTPLDPYEIWPACGETREITEHEYTWREIWREWAERHKPDHPAADPFRHIELSKMKPRF